MKSWKPKAFVDFAQYKQNFNGLWLDGKSQKQKKKVIF